MKKIKNLKENMNEFKIYTSSISCAGNPTNSISSENHRRKK